MTIVLTVEDGTGRVIEQTVDHGDGTGTRTTYDPDGQVIDTSTVDLPLPPEPDPTETASPRSPRSTRPCGRPSWARIRSGSVVRSRSQPRRSPAPTRSTPRSPPAPAKATAAASVLVAAAQAGAAATQPTEGDTL